ncbi:MAG: hypothetical protein IPO90_06470 [Flavobacteriales bacterium]|nr:hypothetical protein [Flavobacteriales bacterium]
MRTSILAPFLALPILMNAQFAETGRLEKTVMAATHSADHRTLRTGDDPLWTEDFENGIAAWTVATTEGAVDWQLTSTGNTAGFTPGPLESSSGYPAGNWIIADSDGQGTGGLAENTSITSPPILGFDTIPFVLLSFEQSFRQLNDDQTLVEVSGNGGTDWSIFPVNTSIGGNQSTLGAPASETVVVNISNALVNGSTDIRLRFRWISDEGFTYAWQIDDIALIPARNNDLVISNAVHAVWNFTDPDYADLPYTIYLQGEQRNLHFRASIGNNGSAPQSDVHLHVEVEGPGGSTTSLNSANQSLAPGVTSIFEIIDYPMPQEIGSYTFHMSGVQAETEDVPQDNLANITVHVDPSIFARDGGTVLGQRDNGNEGFELGNRFLIEEPGRLLQAVDVALGPSTTAGSLIEVTVYDHGLELMAESDIYEVAETEINNIGGGHFISVPLIEALELTEDEVYLVCVKAQIDNGETWVGISGTSPAQTSLIYRNDESDWFYVTTTPMVRMNFNENVGIDQVLSNTPVLTAQPSIFDDHTTIDLALVPVGQLGWDLRDMSGRMVRNVTYTNGSSATKQLILEGDGLADGTYLFTLHTSQGPSTLRLVHQKQR